MKNIVRNAAYCKLCKTEIESKHVHDFRTCPCGNLMVDGGREYLRRGWKNDRNTVEERSTYGRKVVDPNAPPDSFPY